MSDSESLPVVIDLGSSTLASGFAGEEKPRSVIPSLLPLDGPALRPIIHRGEVSDWESLEQLFARVFSEELRVKQEDHPLLLTVPIGKSEFQTNKMYQILFEQFEVPAVYQASEPLLSLYASGSLSGTVLSSGGGLTQAVSVFQGFQLPHSQHRLELAGDDVTRYLSLLLAEKGRGFISSAELEIVRELKEKLAYVAQNYNQEMALKCTHLSKELEKSYRLPDGTSIRLDSELFACAEPLFRPAILDRDMPGIHQMVYRSIMQCDVDTRRELSRNIHLVGGNALLGGLSERLVREVANLLPPKVEVSIAPSLRCDPQLAAWYGGSILASRKEFLWIKGFFPKQLYDESGVNYKLRMPF